MIVRVEKIPILFSNKSIYRLSDFRYGQWLIWENNLPKYYVDLLDEKYSSIREIINGDVEDFLTRTFSQKRLKLSMKVSIFGIPLPSKAKIVELDLAELPVELLI